MTGICGTTIARNAARLNEMLERMRLQPWHAEQCHEADAVSLGALGLDPDERKIYTDAVTGDAAALAGEVYDLRALRTELGCDGDAAELCLAGYKMHGKNFFRRLNGKFALALWDAGAGRLILITDKFGMRPLYYGEGPGGIVFGTAMKALLVHIKRTPDMAMIAQFFAFQQFAGPGTPISGVRRLEPAGWLTYDVRDGRLTVDRYWSATELAHTPAANPAQALEAVDAAFTAAVRRCADGPAGLGLALSGGLDSRAILGLVPKDQPLTCLTLGLPGSMDLWVAEKMAHVMGRAHHRSILGESFFDHYETIVRQMVNRTEGMIPTSGITMPSLELYRQLGITTLLRGHGGELMHMARAYKYSIRDDGLALDSAGALRTWLMAHVAAGRKQTPEMAFLAPRVRALVAPGAQEVVDGWVKAYRDVSPLTHAVWLMFVTHHLPRNVASSIVKFSAAVETRIPYLDANLLGALMAAPPSMKLGDRIQTHILSRHAPELLAAPNTNTGVSMGAPPAVVAFMHFAVRVLAKLGVPGFQPYERLGLWQRREFKPLYEQVLLSARCLDRGIFDREGVRTVIEEHASQRRNHTVLIQSLLCFEVAQRALVDGEDLLKTSLIAPAPAKPVTAQTLVYQPQV